jgi:NADP-dependent 3-hydroxy acid dehydrogenase YdfG
MTQLLTSKTAIIYGAGGSIGSAVARTFAAEGATVHLAGRTREPLERVAAEIGEHAHHPEPLTSAGARPPADSPTDEPGTPRA